jgi:hypothetical protein
VRGRGGASIHPLRRCAAEAHRPVTIPISAVSISAVAGVEDGVRLEFAKTVRKDQVRDLPPVNIYDQRQGRCAVIAPRPQRHEQEAIGRLRQRLQTAYRDRTAAEVLGVVDRAMGRFTTARIREYIPLLVERISRDELSHRHAAG